MGLLIDRGSMVYGPGLVRAYELEDKLARMPRIILDESLAEAWEKLLRIRGRYLPKL